MLGLPYLVLLGHHSFFLSVTITSNCDTKAQSEMSRASSKSASIISIPKSPPVQVAERVGSTGVSEHQAASEEANAVVFHVSVPQISAERRSQYKTPQSSSLVPKIDEIIGECEYGGHLWYFTRFEGGIASRVRVLSSWAFKHDSSRVFIAPQLCT